MPSLPDLPAPVVGAIAGAITGVLGAWGRDALVAWRRRAKLDIVRLIARPSGDWNELYFEVTNGGATTALNCAVQVTLVPGEYARSTSVEDEAPYAGGDIRTRLEHLMLAWAHSGFPLEVSIHPEQVHRVRLGRFKYYNSEWWIPSDKGMNPPLGRFIHAGFEFKVSVGSDSAAPATATGSVIWQHDPKGWVASMNGASVDMPQR